jgi:hypothetical protein
MPLGLRFDRCAHEDYFLRRLIEGRDPEQVGNVNSQLSVWDSMLFHLGIFSAAGMLHCSSRKRYEKNRRAAR